VGHRAGTAALEKNCGANADRVLKKGGHFSPRPMNTTAADVERRAVRDVHLSAKIILVPIQNMQPTKRHHGCQRTLKIT
jgi:hypothetical protein